MSVTSNSPLFESQGKADSTLSVSQISAMIQTTLSGKFKNISIRGEISGFKHHSSGHLYFDLKDDKSVINCVCWRGNASRLKFKPEDGLEVIIHGSVTTYTARSNYQVNVSAMEISGEGALMKLLEERKKKLAAEGLFDSARKKDIPYLPSVIGIITSPTGSVIRDILHRLDERFGVRVLLYPVAVQGEAAAEQVANAIKYFNNLDEHDEIPTPDTLIVARGGGSIEDLWPFNEEIVVRATAASKIPLISAIGHETDTTLIDYASDKRAPTPTAAAEMSVPVKRDLLAGVFDFKQRMLGSVSRYIENQARILQATKSSLISPRQMLENMAQRLDDSTERLRNSASYQIRNKQNQLESLRLRPYALQRLVKVKHNELKSAKSLLESYNYKNVMKRGYSIIHLSDGTVAKSSNDLQSGDNVKLELFDGEKNAVVGNTVAGNGTTDGNQKSLNNKNKITDKITDFKNDEAKFTSQSKSKPKKRKTSKNAPNPDQQTLI